jgi:phospholipase C
VLQDPAVEPMQGYSWRIMPQNLEDAGISWKVYQNKKLGPLTNTFLGMPSMVRNFKASADPRSNLARYGIAPTYPADFATDAKANRLPQVSWIVTGDFVSEHPAFPISLGGATIVNLIKTLLSNPAVWERTALIISYDECGSFFDHVVPPTPPPGTPGEYVTVTDINSVPGSRGIRGPIGLGYRVPCIVVSPFSRGPLVCHDTFDHTSQLKLIGTRFGVPVPNLTAWRNSTIGDMTSAFNFAVPPNPSPPNLNHPALAMVPKLAQCGVNAALGSTDGALPGIPYRVPYPQTMPTRRPRPPVGLPAVPAESLTSIFRAMPSIQRVDERKCLSCKAELDFSRPLPI